MTSRRRCKLLLDRWDTLAPRLRVMAEAHEAGTLRDFPLEAEALHSPLPRAYEWIDGSAYISHIVLVRKARGAEPPATLKTEPLVYQGGYGAFLGPTEDIGHFIEEYGIDFEAEICVVTGDVPMGTAAADAGSFVRLVMLADDVTLRNIVPSELEKGFGFFVSNSALSRWYSGRVADGAAKKKSITAMARQLLIALWRFLEKGIVPEGAELKPLIALR